MDPARLARIRALAGSTDAAPAAAEPRYLPLPKERPTYYHQPPSEGLFSRAFMGVHDYVGEPIANAYQYTPGAIAEHVDELEALSPAGKRMEALSGGALGSRNIAPPFGLDTMATVQNLVEPATIGLPRAAYGVGEQWAQTPPADVGAALGDIGSAIKGATWDPAVMTGRALTELVRGLYMNQPWAENVRAGEPSEPSMEAAAALQAHEQLPMATAAQGIGAAALPFIAGHAAVRRMSRTVPRPAPEAPAPPAPPPPAPLALPETALPHPDFPVKTVARTPDGAIPMAAPREVPPLPVEDINVAPWTEPPAKLPPAPPVDFDLPLAEHDVGALVESMQPPRAPGPLPPPTDVTGTAFPEFIRSAREQARDPMQGPAPMPEGWTPPPEPPAPEPAAPRGKRKAKAGKAPKTPPEETPAAAAATPLKLPPERPSLIAQPEVAPKVPAEAAPATQSASAAPAAVTEPAAPAPASAPPARGPLSTKGVEGKSTEIRGSETHPMVPARYRLVEIEDVTSSHNADLTENRAFPQDLQGRARGERAASHKQIHDMEVNYDPDLSLVGVAAQDGTPIAGPDGVLEAGRGRQITLQRIYDKEAAGDTKGVADAGRYRQRLKDRAAEFGYDPAAVDNFKRPILVRERVTELSHADRKALTQEWDKPLTQELSGAEKARGDAERISSALAEKLKGETLEGQQNAPFLTGFANEVLSPNEASAAADKAGNWTPNGLKRVENALSHYVYGGRQKGIAEVIAEGGEDVAKRPISALKDTLVPMARAKARAALGSLPPSFDITADIGDALFRIAQIRKTGLDVRGHFGHRDMFTKVDPASLPPARVQQLMLDLDGTSIAVVTEHLNNFLRRLDQIPDQRVHRLSLDSEKLPATVDELWNDSRPGPKKGAKVTASAKASGTTHMQSWSDKALADARTLTAKELKTARERNVGVAALDQRLADIDAEIARRKGGAPGEGEVLLHGGLGGVLSKKDVQAMREGYAKASEAVRAVYAKAPAAVQFAITGGVLGGLGFAHPFASAFAGGLVGLGVDLKLQRFVPAELDNAARRFWTGYSRSANGLKLAVEALDARVREEVWKARTHSDRMVKAIDKVVEQRHPELKGFSNRKAFRRKRAEVMVELFGLRTLNMAPDAVSATAAALFDQHPEFWALMDENGRWLAEHRPDLLGEHKPGYLPYYHATHAWEDVRGRVSEYFRQEFGRDPEARDFEHIMGQSDAAMNRLKKRKEMPWEERLKKGLIPDPVYAVERGLREQAMLIETSKFQDAVAQMPEVITTKSLRARIHTLEGAIKIADEKNQPRADLDAELTKLYEELGEKTKDTTKKGYLQLPEGAPGSNVERRFGALAGAYVPREWVAHINEAMHASADATKLTEFWRKVRGTFDTVGFAYKYGKTALSPALHIYQTGGNALQHMLAGTPVHELFLNLPRAVEALMKNDDLIGEAIRNGAIPGDFRQVEMGSLGDLLGAARDMADLDVATASGQAMGWAARTAEILRRNIVGRGYKAAGALYHNNDRAFAIASYLYYRDVVKLDPREAGKRAAAASLPGRNVPPWLKKVGRYWHPFIAFPWMATDFMARVTSKAPLAVLGTLFALKLADYMGDMATSDQDKEVDFGTAASDAWADFPAMFGADEVQTERGKRIRERRSGTPQLAANFSVTAPWRTEHGEQQDIRLHRLHPAAALWGMEEGALPSAAGLVLPSHPAITEPIEQGAGYDLRRQKKFTDPSTMLSLPERGQHLWQTMGPTALQDAERIARSADDQSYYQQQRSPEETALFRMLGIQPSTKFAGKTGRNLQLKKELDDMLAIYRPRITRELPGSPERKAAVEEAKAAAKRLIAKHRSRYETPPQ